MVETAKQRSVRGIAYLKWKLIFPTDTTRALALSWWFDPNNSRWCGCSDEYGSWKRNPGSNLEEETSEERVNERWRMWKWAWVWSVVPQRYCQCKWDGHWSSNQCTLHAGRPFLFQNDRVLAPEFLFSSVCEPSKFRVGLHYGGEGHRSIKNFIFNRSYPKSLYFNQSHLITLLNFLTVGLLYHSVNWP